MQIEIDFIVVQDVSIWVNPKDIFAIINHADEWLVIDAMVYDTVRFLDPFTEYVRANCHSNVIRGHLIANFLIAQILVYLFIDFRLIVDHFLKVLADEFQGSLIYLWHRFHNLFYLPITYVSWKIIYVSQFA